MPRKLNLIPGYRQAVNFVASRWFLIPYFSASQRQGIIEAEANDPVRYGTIALALEQVAKLEIPGALAECGVYRGYLSRFVHQALPKRKYYLFDTFAGFDERDSDTKSDERFKDTSLEGVKSYIGGNKNLVFRQGFFPETAKGLEKDKFAFVVLDFDKYEPTVEALKFFYPRLSQGGYLFVHDYNSPESNWACSRALNEFLADKPEQSIAIPDAWGSALFRKI